MQDENWKSIVGWDGRYEVSDKGRVRSLCHKGKPRISPAILTIANDSRGYCAVSLCQDSKVTRKLVHRVVLEAFVGPCPEGKECGHLNGNPLHNYLSNLAWVTKAENAAHRDMHGTTSRGEDRPLAVFTEVEVRAFRGLLALGFKKSHIADFMVRAKECNPTVARDILGWRTWQHVK